MLARFRTGFIAVALVSAAIGAHSLNLRDLYHEMYPLEPVKQDAFRICDDSDPTFVRAVGTEREACYNKMPHVMAVAMGRIKPGGALSREALVDPSREAELLMTLAAIPPRQPVTAPRSFSDTAWLRALSPACGDRQAVPALAFAAPGGLPPAPGTGRAAALNDFARGKLPALPRAAAAAGRNAAPVVALSPGHLGATADGADTVAGFDPLPAPDIGDLAAPAIVPLAPAKSCGGA